MYAYKVKKLKKKKQQFKTFVFIKGVKRLLLCVNFIKYLILLKYKRKKKNLTTQFFNPLYNYLTEDKNSSVLKIKYRIYRQKLMQIDAQ